MPYCHDQARHMPLIFLLAISQIDDQPGSLHVNTSEVKASQDLVSGVINFICYKIERFYPKTTTYRLKNLFFATFLTQSLQVVPRVLLVWLCDEEMKKQAKGDKYVAFARLNMATGESCKIVSKTKKVFKSSALTHIAS